MVNLECTEKNRHGYYKLRQTGTHACEHTGICLLPGDRMFIQTLLHYKNLPSPDLLQCVCQEGCVSMAHNILWTISCKINELHSYNE